MRIAVFAVTINNAPFTKHMIHCSGIEETIEIMDVVCNDANKDFYAINLVGHGCIVMARNVEQLKNLEYISRKIPEKLVF